MEHADGRRPPDGRDGRPEHWIERDGWPCTEVVPCVGQSAIDRGRAAPARDRRRKKRGGRPGVEVIDVVIIGPPKFTSPDAWKIEEVREFADESASATSGWRKPTRG